MLRQTRWVLACALLAAAGCVKTHFPVTGHVKYKDGRDAKALSGSTVSLEPLEPGKALSCRGFVRDDGSFTIGTVSDDDGVPPGKYKVLVSARGLSNPERPPKGWPPLKAMYGRMDQSPFTFDVEKKDNVLNLEVD